MTLPKFVKMPDLPFKIALRFGIEVKRDKRHGKVGGVCQGIADRFGFDVTLVRLVTFGLILGTFTINNAAFLTYLILWMILPPAYPFCMRRECQSCTSEDEMKWFHRKVDEKRASLKQELI